MAACSARRRRLEFRDPPESPPPPSLKSHRQLPPRNDAQDSSCISTPRLGARLYNRSEEHTSELQSQSNLVCRLLLEKKTTQHSQTNYQHSQSYKSSSYAETDHSLH